MLKKNELFIVVRLMVEDGEGSIELFNKEKPYHLMVEGHL